jgi:hypothetical protein
MRISSLSRILMLIPVDDLMDIFGKLEKKMLVSVSIGFSIQIDLYKIALITH